MYVTQRIIQRPLTFILSPSSLSIRSYMVYTAGRPCTCGHSNAKPLCDGSHHNIKHKPRQPNVSTSSSTTITNSSNSTNTKETNNTNNSTNTTANIENNSSTR